MKRKIDKKKHKNVSGLKSKLVAYLGKATSLTHGSGNFGMESAFRYFLDTKNI